MGRGSRPAKTDYMIIQEFPSRSDNKFNMVLTGDTKAKLNYFMEAAGIDYRKVYFTSAVKCHVFSGSDIKEKHLAECRKYLLSEIMDHQPKVIIPMGRWSYQAVSEIKSIREFRGHFDDFELDYEITMNKKDVVKTYRSKIMPTWSLLGSMRKWEYNDDIIRDFKKAKKYVDTGKIDVTEPPEVNTILTKQGLKDFVELMREAKEATTDYETTGFDFWKDKIINAGYCTGEKLAHVIYLEPYKKEHAVKWNKKEIDRAKQVNSFLKYNRNFAIKCLKTVNAFEHLRLILHNGKFDAKFAKFNGMPYRNFYWDTLRADPLVDENLGHALNVAMERRGINFGAYDTALWPYTNKDEKKKKSYQFVPPPLLEYYLGIDVYGDWLLYQQQRKELKKEGIDKFFFKQSMPALRDINRIEYTGVKYSKKRLLHAADIIDKKQKIILTNLQKETGIEDPKFANSQKQINEYMLAEGYPLRKLKIKQTKTGYSTGKEELEKFLKYKKWAKVPKLILDAKKLSKIRGTYIDGKDGEGGFLQYLDHKNRIHAQFNLWTPRTGRYSCSRPSFQVFPRPIKGLPNTRSFIIPTNKDWMLFEADYSQLEQCIVAVLSKDKVLLQRIQNGMDLHCINAADLGRILKTVPEWVTYEHMLVANGKEDLIKDPAEVKRLAAEIEEKGADFDWKELRTQAKNIGFGLNYGKTAITFAKDFGIPEQDAIDMVEGYFDIYPGMYDWREKIVKDAHEKGYVTLPSGRKRRFQGAMDWINSDFAEDIWSAQFLKEEIARQAMNLPVQGGAHEVFEAACIRLNKRFRKEGLKARQLLSIHDGIVGECPREERHIVKKCMEEEMPQTFHKGTKYELTLKVDVDFYNWEWYGEKFKEEIGK